VADNRQFGSPKVLQFGDKPGNQPGDSGHCGQCEAMLADALDGTLTAEDQEIFDVHMLHCGPCSQLLADAKRGAAWLEMLRDPAPEPPAMLVERILAQTSGAQELGMSSHVPFGMQHAGMTGVALGQAQDGLGPAGFPAYGKVLPFRSRLRKSALGQIVMQPRLAMTAAMAFFSIALTLNLTGVRLQDLRASDLKPSSLKRQFYSAKARSVQYYEGLRVVYELESRVGALENARDNDSAGQNGTTPAAAPEGQAPAAQPEQNSRGQQDQKQGSPKKAKPAPNSGTSRRESFRQPLTGLACVLFARRIRRESLFEQEKEGSLV